MKLTPKQELFIQNYIISLNATESYKRAYGSKNDNTAAKEGHKLLNNPKITQEIKKILDAKKKPLIAEQNEILEFYTAVMRDYKETTKNRKSAADSLAKTYGMFIDKVEANVDSEAEVNVNIKVID